jgi:hypothetical protein
MNNNKLKVHSDFFRLSYYFISKGTTMSYDIKEIWKKIEEGEIRSLELKDIFPFKCKRCNKCCHNRDILMNPFDVIRISHRLKLTTGEFVRKYGSCYIGQYSKLPLVIIRFEKGRCPFLRSYGCYIHQVKPTICRRYPLGRVVEFDKKRNKARTIYFMQELNKECKGLEESSNQTVEDFIRKSQMEIYDQAGEVWESMLSDLGEIVNVIEKTKDKEGIYQILAQILYNPDQFKKKGSSALETLKLIKERIRELGEILE